MNIFLSSLTAKQLRQAADLKEKIAALNTELASLLGASASANAPVLRKMSAAAKAKILAAAKARWAKIKAAEKKKL